MIIVLDTNVIVSGVLKTYSKAATILRLVADGAIQLAYDLRILSEYREVLTRSEFGFSREDIEMFLLQIEEEGLLVSAKPIRCRLIDPDDEPFLEVALAAGAVGMVTGNKRHFPRRDFEGIKILSPAEFLEAFSVH
jgi:putative PIN family toxin of toxin-antitoxin system